MNRDQNKKIDKTGKGSDNQSCTYTLSDAEHWRPRDDQARTPELQGLAWGLIGQ